MCNEKEFGDKTSNVAFFVFRKKNNSYNSETVDCAKSIFKIMNQKDEYTYYCQCINKEDFKDKLYSWCKNIGKLITDETLLVDKKSLDNENFDDEYNWWEDFLKELEKNQSQTKNIKIPKSLLEKIENRKRENRNSFLCIYAHMGEDGMTNGYKDTDSGDEQIGGDINWEELFINIKDYVSTLWLVGCNSHTFADKYIKKFKGGKLKTLLVTTDKKRWVELIRFFEKEYCMDAITFIDDILLDIFKENPDFAMNCKLYAQDENGNLKEKINDKIN